MNDTAEYFCGRSKEQISIAALKYFVELEAYGGFLKIDARLVFL